MKMKQNAQLSAERINEIAQQIEAAEDKSAAIVQAIAEINEAKNEELISRILTDVEESKASANYLEKMGYRTAFTQAEKDFYEKIVSANQAVTFTQSDIIPTEVIDRTMDTVKAESDTLKLVNFAPANVKKWLVASTTGTAVWGALADVLGSNAELSAMFASLDIDVNKLYVYLVVPKAIRELSMPFVDAYFSAVLAEAMHDGLVDGYLNGDGSNAPVGILRDIKYTASGRAYSAKTVHNDLTGLTLTDLKSIKKLLATTGGEEYGWDSTGSKAKATKTVVGGRAVKTLYLIANPSDVYEYVEPALYAFIDGGYVNVSFTKIEVIEEPKMAAGTAALTIADAYTMGMDGIKVNEYKETKAMDDADLFIGKVLANGRPVDNQTAYIFDVTKLQPAKAHVVVDED